MGAALFNPPVYRNPWASRGEFALDVHGSADWHPLRLRVLVPRPFFGVRGRLVDLVRESLTLGGDSVTIDEWVVGFRVLGMWNSMFTSTSL